MRRLIPVLAVQGEFSRFLRFASLHSQAGVFTDVYPRVTVQVALDTDRVRLEWVKPPLQVLVDRAGYRVVGWGLVSPAQMRWIRWVHKQIILVRKVTPKD